MDVWMAGRKKIEGWKEGERSEVKMDGWMEERMKERKKDG